MTHDDRTALKAIICYYTECKDCAFHPSCNWEDATDRTLAVLAVKAIRCAKPAEQEVLMDYAKLTGVTKYFALKAVIV